MAQNNSWKSIFKFGHSDPRASPDRGDQQSTQKSPIPSPRSRGAHQPRGPGIDVQQNPVPPQTPLPRSKGARQPVPGVDVQQNTVPLPRLKGNSVAGSEMRQTGTNSTMQKPLPVKQIGARQDKPIIPGGAMLQTDTHRTNQSDPPSRPCPIQDKFIVPGVKMLQTDTNWTYQSEPSSRPDPRQDRSFALGGEMGQTHANRTYQSEPSSRPGHRQDRSFVPGGEMEQTHTHRTYQSEPHSRQPGQIKQVLEVRYTRGNREKTLDAVFECSHDKFMRLQYMLGHPSLFKQKCDQLKTKNVSDISIEEQEGRKVLVINVGVVTDIVSDTKKEQLSKKVVEEILKDTGNLEVNSFPTSGIDKDNAASMMKEMSRKGMDHDLWLYADEESDCVHYVCPKSRVHHVEILIKEVTDMCLIVNMELELDLVFLKVLDHLKVKDKVKEQYEERVTMAVDHSESRDKCVVILSGRLSDVKAAVKMISEKYKEEFTTFKLSFGDIKKLEPGHKIEQIVRDVFEKPDFVDAYWYVNDTHKKISVCCKTGCQAYKIIWALKTCLKVVKVQPEHQQKIADHGVIPSGTFVMELKGDELEVVGTENAIYKIKQLTSDSQKKEDKKPTSQPETLGAARKVSECTAAGMGFGKRPDKDANEREKKGDKVMIQKSPHVVDEPNIFEMLCASSELFNFAKENNVTLEPLRGKKLAIMACGIQASVKKIKYKIDDLIKEFKEREASAQAEAAKTESERNKIGSAGASVPDTVSFIYKRHWDLNYGHRVAIHPSVTCPGDFALTVPVETVSPRQAIFEIPNKLKLPRWTGGTQQERVLAKKTFKDLIKNCSAEAFHNIKIEIWEIEKKILQFFVIGMFEVLSQKSGIPMTIVICTNGGELYTRLAEFCDVYQPRGSSITRQDHLYPSLPDSEEDLDRTTSEDGNYTTVSPDATCLHVDIASTKTEHCSRKCCLKILEDFVTNIDIGNILKDDATTSCMTVEIIRGQLNGTKADAIVNSTGKDLKLRTGNVSRALLKCAGDGLQQEVLYQRPNGINYGEIVTTGSFKLQSCRCIINGALEGYNGKDLQNLHKFVIDCMVEAERQGCASIAFPAIGTGNLGFPKSGVAKTMFEAVRGFENRRQRLKEVKFVLYQLDTETIQAFEKEAEHHVTFTKETFQIKEDLRYIGQTSVHVKFGTLKDIVNTGIIYVWEKNYSYSVKVKDNALLGQTGSYVQRLFFSHRDKKNTRETTLRTTGGDLPVPFIVHVFSKDSMTSLKEALMEGLNAIRTEDTVCVFFDKNNTFIRYGPPLVDALVQSIKEVQMRLPTLRHVQMTVESKRLALGMLAHLHTVIDKTSQTENASTSEDAEEHKDGSEDLDKTSQTENASTCEDAEEHKDGSEDLAISGQTKNTSEDEEEHTHGSENFGVSIDADQLDNASEDVEQSIEIVPGGHQHIEEEEYSDDSTESDTKQDTTEIEMSVSYTKKVQGKWKDFNTPLEIPLQMENHLKWKYVSCNDSLLQQKLSKIQPFTKGIYFRDGQLEVSLGKRKSNPDFDQLSKKIEEIVLENTDSIVISWFPIPHTEGVDVPGILSRTLNASDIGQKPEIYTETASNGLIRLVYEEKQESAVTALLAKTMKTIKENQHSDNISDTVTLPGVKSQVFHRFQVRPTAKELYPGVEIAFDVVESKDEFVLSMRGPKSQVEEVKQWMINNYDKPYSCVEVPFDQLHMLNEFNDVPSLLEDTLANQPDKLLFWTVNRYTKKVWYCSKEKDVLQKAVADYKTCLKEKSFNTDLLSLGEAEESIYKLTSSRSLQENKISFEVKVKQCELQFRLTGAEDQLNTYTQEVEECFKEESLSQNTVTVDEGNILQTKRKDIHNTHAVDTHPPLDATEAAKINQHVGAETKKLGPDGVKLPNSSNKDSVKSADATNSESEASHTTNPSVASGLEKPQPFRRKPKDENEESKVTDTGYLQIIEEDGSSVDPEDCAFCKNKISDKKVLPCGHGFDRECVDMHLVLKKSCPTCGVDVSC